MGLPLDHLNAPAQAPSAQEEIPILDLGPYLSGKPGALEPLAAELHAACTNIGFHFVVNHGIPQRLIDRLFEASSRFHAQPVERKLELRIDSSVVGYLPMAGGHSRSASVTGFSKPNMNESFFVRNELPPDDPDLLEGKPYRVPNKWPRDLPGFREDVIAYFEAMEALALRMLPVYATALDLPTDWFEAAFARDCSILRLAHYPPSPVLADQFGSAPHSDGSFITLLAQARVPGLEVWTRTGKWIVAPAIDGALLVNSGDLLARWSNDRFLSTPHRVINRSGTDRYSIPFFLNPNIDALMECAPTCMSADNPAKHESMTYLEYYTRTKFAYSKDTQGTQESKAANA